MFFYEGYICPVCEQKFHETEDIVACPQCGAPHHRACWQKEGHCHFQEQHGTDQQWSRPIVEEPAQASVPPSPQAAHTCPHCGYDNAQFAEFCARCGKELSAGDWTSTSPPPSNKGAYAPPGGGYNEYSPFHMPVIDPYGGVPKTEVIEDVSAEDLVNVVGNNSAYYLPRFYKLSKGKKAGFHWAAFLLPSEWLFFRKNYLTGMFLLLFHMARTMISAYIMQAQFAPLVNTERTTEELYTGIQNFIANNGVSLFMWILIAFMLVDLLLRLLLGFQASNLYARTCVRRVKRLCAKKPETYAQELSKAGGTSFLMGASAYAIVYICSILVNVL